MKEYLIWLSILASLWFGGPVYLATEPVVTDEPTVTTDPGPCQHRATLRRSD